MQSLLYTGSINIPDERMDLETRLLTQWEEIEKAKKSKIIEREQKTLLNTAKDSKRIKVIMGPRRAGKSTFLISEIVD
ncbi:MAG: hypothetical protein ACTSYF_15285, partial [Promethearchaeota archaeon]